MATPAGFSPMRAEAGEATPATAGDRLGSAGGRVLEDDSGVAAV